MAAENTRRTFARWSGAVFAVAAGVVAIVVGVEEGSSGTASVLVGPVDGATLMTSSMVVALLALTVGICSIGVPRWMLPLSILGGIAGSCATALAGFSLLMASDSTVTPLVHQGCETGYVAVERSFLFLSTGTIYRHDGPFIVTAVGRSSGDDGHKPFASGTYAFTEKDGVWLVRYANDSSSVGTGGARPLSLPVLTDSERRCSVPDPVGLRDSPDPSPTSAQSPLSMGEVDAAIRDLVPASFAASIGKVVDGSGVPIDSSAVIPITAPCPAGVGTRQELSIAFSTDDNARSLAQILGVWDAAGYDSDRAMQEDIRYSETLPIERMSMRDKSTIDGMLHMTVVSACVNGG